MDFIPAQCAAQSSGAANQLFNLLIQTLLSSYCSISNPGWPVNCENASDDESFDFIVIGAGASGSVVAGRLSENPNHKVLVLEAGGDPPIESEIPALSGALQKSIVDWQYSSKCKNACLGTVNQTCYIPRGRMLGGSSAMNYMIYVRGHKKNYDDWASMGNTNWNYENVLKYFKRWEGNRDPKIADRVNGIYHNQTGPLNVELFRNDPNSKIFLETALEAGIKEILDINANETLGITHAQSFINDGVRQSAAKAYLIPAKDRPNLCVRKYSQAHKILFDENKRAIGVQYNYKGTNNFTVYAEKEIILSAGAIESPHLLLLSGIGPKDELDRFKIPTISDLPVGKNMVDHSIGIVFFKFKGIPPPQTELHDAEYKYLMFKEGPLSTVSTAELEAFINTKNDSQWPDVQLASFYFTQNSSGLQQFMQNFEFTSDIREKLAEVNSKYHIGLYFASLLQPKSTGSIELETSSYTDKPLIKANYLDHPDDQETMVRTIKRIFSFEKSKTFGKHKGAFIALPICDEYQFGSNEYWLCYVRHMTVTGVHTVGTSKMGPENDPTSVVSPDLLVRGVEGLSQADLGVAPYVPSGNTNAAALMIGEKAADLIKGRHSDP